MKIILYFALGISCLALILFTYIVIKISGSNKSKHNLKYRNVKVDDEFYQLMPIKKAKRFKTLYTAPIEELEEQSNDVTTEQFEAIETPSIVVEHKPKKLVLDNKLKLVIHFSNILTPFIEVAFYNKGILEEKKKYILNDYQIENGKILNIEAISELIKKDFSVNASIVLLLSSYDIFKNVISLPKISKSKANKLYQKEIKESFPKYKDNYEIITSNYSHNLGYIYNTFFIPKNIINNFKVLASLLGSRIINVDLFGNYIFKRIKDNYSGSYSLIYKSYDYCLLLNIYNNVLTTIYNFNSNDIDDIINQYLLIVSKHEFSFEKSSISTLLVTPNIYDDIKDRININVKEIELDLDNYFGVN